MQLQLTIFQPLDASRLEEIYCDINESRRFEPGYFLMLVLACLIALLGLLTNSPAVIIGAMLISPLMGPILACGLALTLADWQLGRKALKNVLYSMMEVIAIAAFATWISPLKEITPEILARTNPNLMDLLIAFLSGIAGTLALGKWQKGMTIIPGVAIATAVMPPLAVTGYGLGTMQWFAASGGFMLFFTNLMAIVISADFVFLLLGFRPKQLMAPKEHRLMVRNRILIASLVLAILSIPLVHTLSLAARQARLRREISTFLKGELEQSKKSRISSLDFNAEEDPIPIEVVVRTVNRFDSNALNQLSRQLEARLGRKVQLVVQQVLVEEGGVSETARRLDILRGGGEVVKDFIRSEMAKMPLAVFEQRIVEAAARSSQEAFAMLPTARLQRTRVLLGSENQPLTIQCEMSSTGPLDDQSKAILQNFLSGKLARSVQIEVRNYLTDSKFFIAVPFTEKSTAVSREGRQLLKSFTRNLSTPGFDFVIELACRTSSPDESGPCQRRVGAVKEYLLRSARLDALGVREKGLHPDQNLPAGPDHPEAVILQVVQRM